ncbi:MAG: divalent metal cation transporter [Myxococcota bacterium]
MKKWLSMIGPGICLAGAAIGVSHLMQSTRAGANFGWQLLPLVILTNVFKYPFFEYGHRYAAATGEHLLTGYRRLGKLTLSVYFVLNLLTGFGTIAAVTILTGALASYLFGGFLDLFGWCLVSLTTCLGLIVIGHYRIVDNVVKVLLGFLFICTSFAFAVALAHGPVAPADFVSPSPWNLASLGFLIALMGWMPAPIEISVMQSLWIKANDREHEREKTPLKDALIDYNVGFSLMILTAAMFVGLGALAMHGSGAEFAASNAGFAQQFVQLYTDNLGEWARPFVAVAALTAMFSTTLTVLDGYPRALATSVAVLRRGEGADASRTEHVVWIVVGGATASVVLAFVIYGEMPMTGLIDVVTIIAFLAAPVFAFWNHRLIFSAHVPDEAKPPGWLKAGSYIGLACLVGFGVVYVLSRVL